MNFEKFEKLVKKHDTLVISTLDWETLQSNLKNLNISDQLDLTSSTNEELIKVGLVGCFRGTSIMISNHIPYGKIGVPDWNTGALTLKELVEKARLINF